MLAHLVAVVVLLALAAATFVVSYSGVRAVALQAGVPARLARIYPGLLDATLVIACLAALMLREARWWARCYAWLVIIIVVVVAGGTDAVHAMSVTLPHKQTAGIVAAAPWVLVLLTFSLWLTVPRGTRTTRRSATAPPTATAERETVATTADSEVSAVPTWVPAAPAGTHADPTLAETTLPDLIPVTDATPLGSGTPAESGTSVSPGTTIGNVPPTPRPAAEDQEVPADQAARIEDDAVDDTGEEGAPGSEETAVAEETAEDVTDTEDIAGPEATAEAAEESAPPAELASSASTGQAAASEDAPRAKVPARRPPDYWDDEEDFADDADIVPGDHPAAEDDAAAADDATAVAGTLNEDDAAAQGRPSRRTSTTEVHHSLGD